MIIIFEKYLLLTLAYASFVRLAGGYEESRRGNSVKFLSCLCFHTRALCVCVYLNKRVDWWLACVLANYLGMPDNIRQKVRRETFFLNSAVFFLVRKFYMLRCLFGTLYVDMRCFGVSWFFLSIKSPTQTNGEY